MKNYFLGSIVTLLFFSTGHSQRLIQHLKSGMIEQSQGYIQLFSNDTIVVIYEISTPKKEITKHNFTIINITTNTSTKTSLTSVVKIDPVLFSPHFTAKGFGIFESTYDEKIKTRGIHHHELMFDGSLKSKHIHSYKDEMAENPNFIHSIATHGKISVLYLLRTSNKKNESVAELIFLDYYCNKTSTRSIVFQEKLSDDFKNAVHINSNRVITAVHEIEDKKLGRAPYIYCLTANQENSIIHKSELYKDNSLDVLSYRTFIDDKNMLQLFGIFRMKADQSKYIFLNLKFSSDRGKMVQEKRYLFDFSEKHTLHGVLTITDNITIFAATSHEPELATDRERDNPRENRNNGGVSLSSSATNQGTETEEEILRKKEELNRQQTGDNNNHRDNPKMNNTSGDIKTITFVCTDSTGRVVWQNSFKTAITKGISEKHQLSPTALDYAYWSDGTMLYCLYNSIEATENSNQLSRSTAQEIKISPFMRIYDLKSGRYSEKPLNVKESIPNMTFLIGIINLTTSRFGIVMTSLPKGNYMPTMIYW